MPFRIGGSRQAAALPMGGTVQLVLQRCTIQATEAKVLVPDLFSKNWIKKPCRMTNSPIL